MSRLTTVYVHAVIANNNMQPTNHTKRLQRT